MIRGFIIGSTLLIAQAVPAFAEFIQLVCDERGVPVTVIVNLTNKTVKMGGFTNTSRADISDTIISFRGFWLIGGGYTVIEIDRVSGVVTGRYCPNGNCGEQVVFGECHKGSQQF